MPSIKYQKLKTTFMSSLNSHVYWDTLYNVTINKSLIGLVWKFIILNFEETWNLSIMNQKEIDRLKQRCSKICFYLFLGFYILHAFMPYCVYFLSCWKIELFFKLGRNWMNWRRREAAGLPIVPVQILNYWFKVKNSWEFE